MARQSIQKVGGAFTSVSQIENNFNDLYASLGIAAGNPFATNFFVDGDNGNDTNDGLAPSTAKKTIQGAINAASQGDRVWIKPLEGDSASGDTDPDSYTENLTISGKDGLQLIGCGRGLSQGGQPQLKVGATTTSPILTVNSFGCGVYNLTFNGAGATGGGIVLNGNGSTADAGGFIAAGCHFKNAKSSGAAATGGAIYWSTNGAAWYVSIYDCEFIDCRAGIVLVGTSQSQPRHVKIVGNRFGSAANTTVDADIYIAVGGIIDLIVDRCVFATVDVPAYASSPSAARYIWMGAGTTGIVSNCVFACIGDPAGSEKTIGAAGTAAIIPTTVRVVGCYGEGVAGTGSEALIGRT